MAPTVWNKVVFSVRSAPSVISFTKRQKTHYFKKKSTEFSMYFQVTLLLIDNLKVVETVESKI